MMSSMARGEAARLYHRLSSYTYWPEDRWSNPIISPPIDHPLVLQDFVPYVSERFPPDIKVYPMANQRSRYRATGPCRLWPR
jgi:hypothetical protein